MIKVFEFDLENGRNKLDEEECKVILVLQFSKNGNSLLEITSSFQPMDALVAVVVASVAYSTLWYEDDQSPSSLKNWQKSDRMRFYVDVLPAS
ncbi:jg15540 [Pararge aegeria aegeria]|uniref:Jg15540 protein n=1 Tax=Pararge aegeria aegeria TaxID=348720 RepID=A0A8S4RU05_9NEOP|nr:jg15540 [Pararge aegeria aegeria]